MTAAAISAEINRRDYLGRTVLHLAVTELAEWALDWVELLLSVPGLQVNAADTESGWSALHRALYAGNIAAARQLLARDDVDARLKDHEGLTPFDIYNSTVEGTNPSDVSSTAASARLELFTWGANRNYVLGFSGDGDRVFPERVQLMREEGQKGLDAFEPLRIREVSMARLHTGIVTDEARNNIRLCGYGTGGRLGPSTHTQFTFAPLPDFPHQVASVVLSPDHTVVVTTSGHVYTFGLNRFEQLGYTIDAPTTQPLKGVSDEPIQSVPKRVVGALKKEVVLGAAASRTHTAVFTSDSLFTWGTNKGQLGYATPGSLVQVLPRKVTTVQTPIIQLSATENATACLLESKDVLVLYHEGYLRIVFPLARFPSKMQTYRPPQVSSISNIDKIVSSGNTFVALSSLGDVFSFNLDSSTTKSASDTPGALARMVVKPQRIWSLRRQFTGVTDVGVGLDGAIILSTRSGHVFVRTKRFEAQSNKIAGTATPPAKSGSTGWKFSRVPYLQRVVKVAANSTGGFAAIRADVPLRPIEIEGPTLSENLLGILPHWRKVGPLGAKFGSRRRPDDEESDDEADDAGIEKDVEIAVRMTEVLEKWDAGWEEQRLGSTTFVVAGRLRLPVHGLLLAVRSSVLAKDVAAGKAIVFPCSEMTALLLLHYLYSDDLIPIWDSRVGSRLREACPSLDLDIGAVKEELKELANRFELPALTQSLHYHAKTPPKPTLVPAVRGLLTSPSFPAADIVLVLADREVKCHSVVLRARCSVFETFYADVDWTLLRGEEGTLRYDLSHIDASVMSLVLSHLYGDAGLEMFDSIDFPTTDEYIDFVTLVLAAANELLLDKLKAICSGVLRRFVTLHNVCSILVDAAFYEAEELSRACMHFIACSMETVLEGRLLDDLPPDLLAAVSAFCQERQGARLPISRSGLLVSDLMAKHSSWVADLDLAKPTGGARKFKATVPRSPGPSPSLLSPAASPHLLPHTSPQMRATPVSPSTSPLLQPARESHDEPFSMDDDFSLDSSPVRPTFAGSSSSTPGMLTPARRVSVPGQFGSPSTPSFTPLGSPPPPRLQPWTAVNSSASKPPMDLRGIMASEAASRPQPSTSGAKSSAPTPVSEQRQAPVHPPASRPEPSRPVSHRATLAPAPPAGPPSNPSSAIGAAVIVPTRQGNRAASGSRPKASFGAADIPWTNYSAAPTPAPAFDAFSASPSTPPLASFASIQSQQRAEVEAVRENKAPRSFADVMAQEREDAQRKAEEEDFERWWAQESERVRRESEATFLVRKINATLRSQPALLESIVSTYLTALAIADLTHIGFTFYDLGLPGTLDVKNWNTLVWGNCVITFCLFIVRMMWFAGIGRASAIGSGKVKTK
ncbi:BTB domain and ankyrin repeat containing protein [Pseudohyphozyma bogoriensis]|nr:BTB domain and ankyrin repeat containing protein [Pseudohyphozyma bogoriensis]